MEEIKLDRRTIIFLPDLTPLGEDPVAQLGTFLPILLRLSRRIHKQHGTPTVVIVTSGAFMGPTDTECSPVSAAIEAAVRVMANELPQSTVRVIDLPVDQKDWPLQRVQEELLSCRHDRRDTVVVLRPGGRFVRRITVLGAREADRRAMRSLPARGGQYFCEPGPSGLLDDIVIRRQDFRTLQAEEVAIEVHCASLNFKDVMNAMNLLGERSVAGGLSGGKLGLEVAGKVVAVGDKVKDIQIGTDVMARAVNGLGGSITTHRSLVVPVPGQLTLPQAASIPIAFITAYYALVYLGRLAQGDTVLIHAAAGGVGAAAIQIAKLYGARIFATAGNPSRRNWVSSQGVEAVFDSRSVSFHDDVKAATGGRGVDMVLNCLTGSLLYQSFACLAPFGRFLEIGKVDIYRNMKLGLEIFGENRSFLAVDVDRMTLQKPALHLQMLGEVCALFESGKLLPPPITEYPIAQLPVALKSLSRSGAIGKVVVTMDEKTTVCADAPIRLSLRSDRSYVITGGASGLGLQLARFLTTRGARHLVLVSRSGPKTAEDIAILGELEAHGATIILEHMNIIDKQAVASLFGRSEWPAVAGVIHCAAVMRDISSYNMSEADFWTVFNPKALGAWNLHLATKDLTLDFLS